MLEMIYLSFFSLFILICIKHDIFSLVRCIIQIYISKTHNKELYDKDTFLSEIVKSIRADDIALVYFARVIRTSGSGLWPESKLRAYD